MWRSAVLGVATSLCVAACAGGPPGTQDAAILDGSIPADLASIEADLSVTGAPDLANIPVWNDVSPDAPTCEKVWGSSATNIWVAGRGGYIGHSVDGKTWQQQDSGTANLLNSLSGLDDQEVFVAGEKATILHTTDGGQTWLPEQTSIVYTDEYSGLRAFDADHVYALGLHHVFQRRTVDGMWAPIPDPPMNAQLEDIWRDPSSGTLFAVGSPTTILRLDFGADAWQQEMKDRPDGMWTLWGPDAFHLYTVGSDLIYERQAPNTWTSLPNPLQQAQNLAGVWGSGIDDIFAVGTNQILRSSDGMTWTAQTVGATDLRSVWGSGPGDVYATGLAINQLKCVVLHYKK